MKRAQPENERVARPGAANGGASVADALPRRVLASPRRAWAKFTDYLTRDFHPPAGRSPAWFGQLVLPLFVAGLMMLSFVTIQPPPYPAESDAYDADPSLSAVLHYASVRGLQFGTDLAYTYGPFGFLVFVDYFPHAVGWHLCADVALGFAAAAGLCLVGWRLGPFWRWLLLGSFVFAAANIQHRTELILQTSLFCWGWLCLLESERRLAACTLMFIALAVFGALAKVSFLFIGGASALLLALDLWLRGYRRTALGLVTGVTGGFVLGWVGCGQDPRHIGPYVINSLAVVQGYGAALGWEQPELAARTCRRVALLLLALVPLRILFSVQPAKAPAHARRALLLAWILCFAAPAWKHGVVRWSFDYLAICLTFLTVIAFSLDALPCRRPRIRLWGRLLATACCLATLSGLQTLGFMSLARPLVAFSHNWRCLTHPQEYERSMTALAEINRRRAQLPRLRQIIGNSTVDLFGRRQAYAIFNGLNYRPRPMPQSYASCNAALMALNERFYLSEAAPDYVLFELSTMDRKFPPLEDARVLRDLAINYRPVASEGLFLLLKRVSSEPPRLAFLRQVDSPLGQPIDFSSYGEANLWLEIDLRPSWAGRLQQLLWRPPTVRLAVWRRPGHGLIFRHRAPPSMLSAGFLVSPLLLGTPDLLSLLTGEPVVRPGACSIELPPGGQGYWQETVRVRLYRVENRMGQPSAPGLFSRLANPAWPPPSAARTKEQ